MPLDEDNSLIASLNTFLQNNNMVLRLSHIPQGNPKAKKIIEIIHQVIGNIVDTYNPHKTKQMMLTHGYVYQHDMHYQYVIHTIVLMVKSQDIWYSDKTQSFQFRRQRIGSIHVSINTHEYYYYYFTWIIYIYSRCILVDLHMPPVIPGTMSQVAEKLIPPVLVLSSFYVFG